MTLEFALALPALVMVLGIALASIVWALNATRAQHAAAEGARAAVVEADATALDVARRAAGGAGEPRLMRVEGWVTVCVAIAPRGLLPGGERCATAREVS